MKTLKIGAFAILGLLAVACNDDENNNTAKLTSEEQAEMVASSLGRTGFVGSAEQSAGYADDAAGSGSGRQQECGWTNDFSASLGGPIGDVTFSLAFAYEVALNCDGNDEPESFTANFEYEGNYTSPRFESAYDGNGELTITELGDDDDDSFEIDGSYDREGSFKTKVNGEVTEEGRHEININVDDVRVRKSDRKVIGGEASVDANGSIEGRGSYSFSATVDFTMNGDTKMAVIKVAGDTYHLNLETNVMAKVEN